MSHQSCGYRVTRLVFDAGQPYETFRGRYEAAVPPADLRPGADMTPEGTGLKQTGGKGIRIAAAGRRSHRLVPPRVTTVRSENQRNYPGRTAVAGRPQPVRCP